MFSIARLYNSASSYAAKPIPIQPIFMSIKFHHYKQLARLSKEIESVNLTLIQILIPIELQSVAISLSSMEVIQYRQLILGIIDSYQQR
jgi:hypothetical protein